MEGRNYLFFGGCLFMNSANFHQPLISTKAPRTVVAIIASPNRWSDIKRSIFILDANAGKRRTVQVGGNWAHALPDAGELHRLLARRKRF